MSKCIIYVRRKSLYKIQFQTKLYTFLCSLGRIIEGGMVFRTREGLTKHGTIHQSMTTISLAATEPKDLTKVIRVALVTLSGSYPLYA